MHQHQTVFSPNRDVDDLVAYLRAVSGLIAPSDERVALGNAARSKLNPASRRVMSHSEALSRLTVGDRRNDMLRWALRKGIDKLERILTVATTLQRQRCPVLDYLVAVRTAHLHGDPLPTIIPS